MSLTVSVAPASEPVTQDEVDTFLRIDDGDVSQDTLLVILIQAGREAMEGYLRRSIINTTWSWELDADELARQKVFFPRPTVSAITSVTTYDVDSNRDESEALIDSGNYQLIGGSYMVQRKDGFTVNRFDRAATIIYVAGFGANATSVPFKIKRGILRWIATEFYARSDKVTGTIQSESKNNWMTGLDEYIYNGI